VVALSSRQRGGLVCLAAGLAWVALVQVLAPAFTPPLYDGVVAVDAYRWLTPPPGGHGGAEGASSDVPVTGDVSPLVAISTPEQPPQAQVFATPGSFVLPPGTRSLHVSIAPIPAERAPGDGHIAGNVYRFIVATKDGTALRAPASAKVSIVMRAPEGVVEATIERYRVGSWAPLHTSPAGLGGTFLAVVTEFGDFALVEAGPGRSIGAGGPGSSAGSPAPGSGAGSDPPLWLIVVAGLGLAAGAGALALTMRQRGGPGRDRRFAGDRPARPGAGGRGSVPRKGGGRKGRRR
jgi:hypothetical protein